MTQYTTLDSCPMTSKIPRCTSLTCEEESVLSIFGRQRVRFARFVGRRVATRDNEVCPSGRLGDRFGRFPGCMNVSASRPPAAGRGKLSGRRRRSSTTNWQKGKFGVIGQLTCDGTGHRPDMSGCPFSLKVVCARRAHLRRDQIQRDADRPLSHSIWSVPPCALPIGPIDRGHDLRSFLQSGPPTPGSTRFSETGPSSARTDSGQRRGSCEESLARAEANWPPEWPPRASVPFELIP